MASLWPGLLRHHGKRLWFTTKGALLGGASDPGDVGPQVAQVHSQLKLHRILKRANQSRLIPILVSPGLPFWAVILICLVGLLGLITCLICCFLVSQGRAVCVLIIEMPGT